MPIIVIANPKGGVGKSTLATNLAGYFAHQGHAVLLGDSDVQQSSRYWLSVRPSNLPPIATWNMTASHIAKPPKGTSHVVLDTPAGLHGKTLDKILAIADKVIVPLQASLFDIAATQPFFEQLNAAVKARAGTLAVGVVGMRVDERTRSAEQLKQFLATHTLPIVTYLRNTQNYVQLAAHGLTLWDIAPSRVEQDLAQWQPLLTWAAAPISAKSA